MAIEHGLRFDCAGESLVGMVTMPAAAANGGEGSGIGVVIAVGGPQYRAGSHRQFVLLARRLAAAGYPVLRFDCRGMGDSTGEFPGFEQLGPELAAAATALRDAAAGVRRIVLWGLCDAASAALLNADAAPGWAGLVLLNPWVRHADTHARTEVKHYYAQRALDPVFWRKLASGQVRVGTAAVEFGGKLWRMLRASAKPAAASPPGEPLDYRERMARGACSFGGPQLYVLSGRDHVCAEFIDHASASPAWAALWSRPGVTRLDLPAADHTFSSAAWRGVVEDATLDFLARLSAPPG